MHIQCNAWSGRRSQCSQIASSDGGADNDDDVHDEMMMTMQWKRWWRVSTRVVFTCSQIVGSARINQTPDHPQPPSFHHHCDDDDCDPDDCDDDDAVSDDDF